MRRALASLLLALAIVSPLLAQSAATSGPTTRYSRLYVFGDSYSDIGAGYIDGDGPTAVAYLGWLMGLQVASSRAANAAGKSLVFAVSGAGTGEGTGRQVKEALLGYGMMNQVRDFAARVKAGEIRFDPQTTLFFLAGGLNDSRQETAITLANTTDACAGRAIFDQDPTPVGDPATYFFYHNGHPSTAVHRIVGKKLFEEIAARSQVKP